MLEISVDHDSIPVHSNIHCISMPVSNKGSEGSISEKNAFTMVKSNRSS